MAEKSGYNIAQATLYENIAELFSDEELETVGKTIKEEVDSDEISMRGWKDATDEWMRLALQVSEQKDFPWPNASNVKYPLVTMAAMQFHARALPNLINSSNPVRAKVIGMKYNPRAMKRASRVSYMMSYQILEEMEEWLDTFDRQLFVLPMVGCVYKKTFYNTALRRSQSLMLMPGEFTVSYYGNLETCRITHNMFKTKNQVIELQRSGKYLDIPLDTPAETTPPHYEVRDESHDLTNSSSKDDVLYSIKEAHCWYDLDGDGYKEPYIITYDDDSGKILRIIARWSAENIFYTEAGDVQSIIADTYFTPYIFIPDPNSDTLGLGFGHLLGPNNAAVNSLINQLVDAGTLSNLGGGFLARGVKIPGGAIRTLPGEWKHINTTGDDLRKGIFPFPIKDPSPVLLSLLQLLIGSGERISSVSDMMAGESPGQNQPANTTLAVLEQGLQVFSSIYRRIHRALAKEYKKLYELNYYYLDEDFYNDVLMDDVGLGEDNPAPDAQMVRASIEKADVKKDFAMDSISIVPASDPNFITETQKTVKSNSLMQKLAAGFPLNGELILRKALEAEGHDDIDELMKAPPPQPNPEFVLKEREFEHKVQKENKELKQNHMRILQEGLKDAAQAENFIASAKQTSNDIRLSGYDMILRANQAKLDAMAAEDERMMKAAQTLEKQTSTEEKLNADQTQQGEV